MENDLPTPKPMQKKVFSHYYGDQVRTLFIVVAIVMLLGLPLFKDKIPQPISLSITAVVFLVFLAGLTNPMQVWVTFLGTVVSLVGFVIFEYYAITNSTSLLNSFFLINQIIALIFLMAFYFSSKTLRAFYIRIHQ